MKKRAAEIKAMAIEKRDTLSRENPDEVKKIRKLDMIIRYATGINRLYILAVGIILFVFAGLLYTLYPDISFTFVSCVVGFAAAGWAFIWLSIFMQIKLWNRAIKKIQTA